VYGGHQGPNKTYRDSKGSARCHGIESKENVALRERCRMGYRCSCSRSDEGCHDDGKVSSKRNGNLAWGWVCEGGGGHAHLLQATDEEDKQMRCQVFIGGRREGN